MSRLTTRMYQLAGSLLLSPFMCVAQTTENEGASLGPVGGSHHPVQDPFTGMAAITALLIVAIAVSAFVYMTLREKRKHHLLITFIERGQEIPPRLLPPVASRLAELRRATRLTGFGIGVGLVLYIISGDAQVSAWCLIPLCLGIASFVNAALFYKSDDVH